MPEITWTHPGLGRYVGIRALLRITALAVLFSPGSAVAQAATWVPLHDPAYADLDVIIAGGLVREIITGERPYASSLFARAAAEARAAATANSTDPRAPQLPARSLEALSRLEARFGAGARARSRGVALLSSWADSPTRPVPEDPRLWATATGSLIDADIAPLLQRNLGVDLRDGGTVVATAWRDASLGSRFAASVAPRLWFGTDGGGAAGLAVDHAYVRGVFGNVAVTVGRNAVVHGHARELGTALSTNVRGLDMVRLSMDRPGRLPWILRHLGPASGAATVATLGPNRAEEWSTLIVWEGAVRPHRNFELGVTLMNQQGGNGAPEATVWERILEVFFLHKRAAPGTTGLPPDPNIGDKLIGMNAQWTIPGPKLEVFAEVTTTDDHDLFVSRPEETFWYEAAWAVGLRRFALGREGRWDLWAEAGRVGVRTYAHHQMTSGLTLDRRIIGSPLGPLAAGFTAGTDWTGARDRVSLSGAWERYSRDRWAVIRAPDWHWFRTADNPDEIRVRGTVDWAREPAATGLRTTVRLGYEHVTRFDFTDRNRSNFLAQVGVGWVW
ncbi:MAG TPA: capsule assembly Wzi family protein [Longimicrobiales bacterium]|nr:capsule assembly Wzi family protein [Longimicrobiales bacterium]